MGNGQKPNLKNILQKPRFQRIPADFGPKPLFPGLKIPILTPACTIAAVAIARCGFYDI